VDRSLFVEPEFVHYAGPDGQSVPAWLFVPNNLDRGKKHPQSSGSMVTVSTRTMMAGMFSGIMLFTTACISIYFSRATW
jgi:hypothetical protein